MPITTAAPIPQTAAGLINLLPTSATVDTQMAATPTAVSTPATTQREWEVTRPQTVAGQVEDIIRKDSPLQQLAASQAMQQANKRGLINSNLAVQSAQNAVYQNALPIAQQDAQTFGAAGQTNATEANKLGVFNTELDSKNQQFNIGEQNKTGMFNAELDSKNQQFNIGEQNKTGMFNAELDSKNQQFNIGEQNKLLMQSQGFAQDERIAQINMQAEQMSAQNEGMRTFYDTYQRAVNSILTNPELTPESKETALQMQSDILTAGIGMYQDIDASGIDAILSGGSQTSGGTLGDTLNAAVTSNTQTSGGTLGDTLNAAVTSNTQSDLADRQAQWDADKAAIVKESKRYENSGIVQSWLKGWLNVQYNKLGPRPTA